ncbi:MAG: hypothetical protein JXR29_11305, partial [Methylothermaceae bacterium]|nr:hypothetical protein [Methylothermaceae bacterium]
GDSARSLGLTGRERYRIPADETLAVGAELTVTAEADDGTEISFPADVRLNSAAELEYYRNGGILQTVLRNMLTGEAASA